jgi:transcriptional regulator with XRE-family HTH domain
MSDQTFAREVPLMNDQTISKEVPLHSKRRLLRKFREQYGITLVELGKLAGISQPMLSQFESGDRNLSPDAWADVLIAIGKLLEEYEAKRNEQFLKAKETAAKLTNSPLPSFIPPLMAEALLSPTPETQEQIETRAEFFSEVEQVANDIAAGLATLDPHEWDRYKALLAEPPNADNAEKFRQALSEALVAIERTNAAIADLHQKGYVILPASVEQERDQLRQRVAALEAEIRDLKGGKE